MLVLKKATKFKLKLTSHLCAIKENEHVLHANLKLRSRNRHKNAEKPAGTKHCHNTERCFDLSLNKKDMKVVIIFVIIIL